MARMEQKAMRPKSGTKLRKIAIVEASIDNFILCAMAQIGERATIEEIVTEIRSYNGGENVERHKIESALYALLFIGEVTRHNDGWQLCPIEESAFDYSE